MSHEGNEALREREAEEKDEELISSTLDILAEGTARVDALNWLMWQIVQGKPFGKFTPKENQQRGILWDWKSFQERQNAALASWLRDEEPDFAEVDQRTLRTSLDILVAEIIEDKFPLQEDK